MGYRSRMARRRLAATTLILGLSLAGALAHADDLKATTKASDAKKPESDPKSTYKVTIDLNIAGLGPKGCDVDIKAAHPGCKFNAVTCHIGPKGQAFIDIKDIESLSADRDCTFAITVREPGQASKTIRRGLRLKASNAVAQDLRCYLSSPSKLAKSEKEAAETKR